MGYEAARLASEQPVQQGNVGNKVQANKVTQMAYNDSPKRFIRFTR
ncbi:hypothetical protein [Brevibacillus formosus]